MNIKTRNLLIQSAIVVVALGVGVLYFEYSHLTAWWQLLLGIAILVGIWPLRQEIERYRRQSTLTAGNWIRRGWIAWMVIFGLGLVFLFELFVAKR